MLDNRMCSDRRNLETRRNGLERRLNAAAVNMERRTGSDRRSITTRRIYNDRRRTAISYRDIA